MRLLLLALILSLGLSAQTTSTVVTVTKDGGLFVNENPVSIANLVTTVKSHGTPVVYVRADRGTTWDAMVRVLSALEEAHIRMKFVAQLTLDGHLL